MEATRESAAAGVPKTLAILDASLVVVEEEVLVEEDFFSDSVVDEALVVVGFVSDFEVVDDVSVLVGFVSDLVSDLEDDVLVDTDLEPLSRKGACSEHL